ncbi:MAG: 4-alpha-glucanotransferase [Planctomycetaceae bacterium]|nr:4-alpha-glucanotransferase [Planctomycetaceae bacterium]
MPLRVLMLGWEFPPFITGGLGTACYGLVKAMDRAGMETTFVLPKSVPGGAVEEAPRVSLVSPASELPETRPEFQPQPPVQPGTAVATPSPRPSTEPAVTRVINIVRELRSRFENVNFVDLPVDVKSVYQEQETIWSRVVEHTDIDERRIETLVRAGAFGDVAHIDDAAALHAAMPERDPAAASMSARTAADVDYGGDMVGQAHAYAGFCLEVAKRTDFDIIHAHDWLTYPAGLAVSQLTGKPLVVHVHSTEFDRSGEHVNQQQYNIERRGMHGAMKVVAVSQLTKNLCVARYGIPDSKVEVVYNGVEFDPIERGVPVIENRDKIVLYFGRITMQKGPEFFVQAAKRVLDVMEDVKFVVAGSGDLASEMIEMAAEMGIGHKVLFTGFLRGNDIKRVFSLADLYVMPSVSEPFGIAPLEAMSHDVPALISKSSGVSEVLTHALKVDFWDVEEMANKIVAVLRHPPLRTALQDNGLFEVRALTWDGAATRCRQVYESVLRDAVPSP